jgi:DNA-binding transcriptional LysR family regulator
MNEPRPDIAELTFFTTVASLRSFRKAADELRVSPSTLSHAVRRLEERMGVRLLNRTTRSVAPTEAGEALLEKTLPLLQGLRGALAEVAEGGGPPRGSLRINTNIVGARVLLRDVVPVFRMRCPNVHVDLVVEGRIVDIVAEGFDAGVRLREAVPRDMVAVSFGGDTRFVAVASPKYLERHPPLRTPHDLLKHDCIRYRFKSGKLYRWEFERRGQTLTVDVNGPLTLNDDDLMVQAAVDGHGIAFVAEPFARSELQAGRLAVVLGAWSPRLSGLALYYPGHRQVPPALRAFVSVLKESRPGAAGVEG